MISFEIPKMFDFDVPLFPESASTFAPKVDALYFFTLALTAFFTLLIFVGVIFLFVKYRRKSEDEMGEPIHGSLVLEIAWSIIPFIIVMFLFAWGAEVFLVGMRRRKTPRSTWRRASSGCGSSSIPKAIARSTPCTCRWARRSRSR